MTQIKTYSWDNAQVILVGNKCDMEEERVISQERGKQLADQLGVEFFETSAKENVNVKVCLRKISNNEKRFLCCYLLFYKGNFYKYNFFIKLSNVDTILYIGQYSSWPRRRLELKLEIIK